MTISVSYYTLLKIHSHAFKHPSKSVNGILLGKVNQKNEIDVTNIIPLFHTHTLLPMFEVAMIQIEEYCKNNKNKETIVGYYHGNEGLAMEMEAEPIAKKISDKLYNELNKMCFLIITKIDSDQPTGLMQMDRTNSGDWLVNRSKSATVSINLNTSDDDDSNGILIGNKDNLQESLKEILKSGKHSKLYDFEDYLYNAQLDWINQSFLK
eukprot:gene9690-11897_t